MKTIFLLGLLIIGAFSMLYADPPKSGASLGTITTTDGKTYADAKLAVIEPDGISILYSDGGAKIPFTSLSPEIQKQFGYDPEKSAFYAREQQYLTTIDRLQQENAELRKRLGMAVEQKQVTAAAIASAPQPTVAGYHAFFYSYLKTSTRVGGPVNQGYPKYRGGALAGMGVAQADTYVQQLWQALSHEDQMAWEKQAQMYGDPIAKQEAAEAIQPQQTVSHATVIDQNGNASQVQVISQ